MSDNLYQDLPSGSSELFSTLETKIEQLETELKSSHETLQDTLERLSELENRIPDSNIISPKLISRAFTVWGHYFVAQTLLVIPILCIFFILALVMAAFEGFALY